MSLSKESMIIGNYSSQESTRNSIQRLSGLIIVYGPHGVGKRSFIQNVCRELGFELTSIVDFDIATVRDWFINNSSVFANQKSVLLIDDAEKLNLVHQDALLKSFEEDINDRLYVLVSSNLERISPTLVSRSRATIRWGPIDPLELKAAFDPEVVDLSAGSYLSCQILSSDSDFKHIRSACSAANPMQEFIKIPTTFFKKMSNERKTVLYNALLCGYVKSKDRYLRELINHFNADSIDSFDKTVASVYAMMVSQ